MWRYGPSTLLRGEFKFQSSQPTAWRAGFRKPSRQISSVDMRVVGRCTPVEKVFRSCPALPAPWESSSTCFPWKSWKSLVIRILQFVSSVSIFFDNNSHVVLKDLARLFFVLLSVRCAFVCLLFALLGVKLTRVFMFSSSSFEWIFNFWWSKCMNNFLSWISVTVSIN